MTDNPFIRLDGLAKRWNGQLGVEDISLTIGRGEFVALLGPSGCGKTTTLRLIAGLETPDEGRIEIDGTDVTGLGPSERNLAMVFQSYALFPHLNVAENIVFGLKVRRTPATERKARLAEALAMTGLTGYEKRKPAELSGGQRQRVALARAVVAGHPLCLMDEPLSNLDAKLRQSVKKDIKALQRKLGITIIYVTHDQHEAMSMADQIVLMRDGRIIQAGPPSTLYNRPTTTFTAEFIGHPPMALIAADASPRLTEMCGDAGLTVGVRPEHLTTAPDAQALISATVTDCDYMGSETLVNLFHPKARGLTLRLEGDARVPSGTRLDLGCDRAHLHLFHQDGGRLAPVEANPTNTTDPH